MGLLEDILARSQWMPQAGAFPPILPPVDETAEAEAARTAAGQRQILANRRRPPNPLTQAPDEQSAGVQLALENAPPGTGVPFSTDAGMLAPPYTAPGPVEPLPPPITVGSTPTDLPPDRATDFTSRARGGGSAGAPLQTAPVAPMAPAAAYSPEGQPSILDRIRTGLGDNSNVLLALGAGLAGAPNIGQGISRAAAAAIPARAADIKQKLALQAQTYGTKALVDAGVPIQQAIAAQGNPELMKALIQTYIGDRKTELKEITLPNGTKMSVMFNPFTQKATDLQGRPIDIGGMGSPEAAAAEGLVGEEYLKRSGLSENDMMNARKVANYELDPKLIPARGNNRERILAAAEHYDPDFQSTLLPSRMAAIKEFTSGGPNSPSSTLVAGRTAINHFGKLSDLSEQLGGTDHLWLLNKPANWTREQYQEFTQNPVLQAYKVGIDRATEEATKFYRGTGGNQADIQRGIQRLAASRSPDARRAAIAEETEFMQSKIGELENKWRAATGPSGWKTALQQGGGNFPILSAQNERVLERVRRRRAGESIPPEGPEAPTPPRGAAGAAPVEPTATDPKTGRKAVYRNGAWQILPQ